MPVVGPWASSEVNRLPQGANQGRLIDPDSVRNGILCRNGDGVCWVVDGNAVRHWIPSHADNVCWRWGRGWQVRRWVDGDQANSLPEADAWGCSMNAMMMVTSTGARYYMEGNTRRWIQDMGSWDYYAPGRQVINGIGQAEANGIPEGSWMPRRLPDIRNKVILAPQPHAYFIDGAGLWHWIPDGGIYGCLVNKYGGYRLDTRFPWEQIDTRRREGAHANCSM
jgi:hypothetical protein